MNDFERVQVILDELEKKFIHSEDKRIIIALRHSVEFAFEGWEYNSLIEKGLEEVKEILENNHDDTSPTIGTDAADPNP